MIPEKIPEANYSGMGVNMLVTKINEIISYLETPQAPNPAQEVTDQDPETCPHDNTYQMGVMTKCKDCKKMWRTE